VAKKQSELADKAQMVKELEATRFGCLSPLGDCCCLAVKLLG